MGYKSDAGKGSLPRPCLVGKEELDLRKKLAWGEIGIEEYTKEYIKLLKAGKITRDGKIIKE